MAISDEGIIYGSTLSGGSFGSGVIYSINHDGTEYKKLHEFTWGLSMTNFPATLVVGSDDMLYGTNHLGSTSYGCIYAVAKDGTGFKEVLKFNSVGMQSPAGLFQGQDGRLYGLSRGSSSSAPHCIVLTRTVVASNHSSFSSVSNQVIVYTKEQNKGYMVPHKRRWVDLQCEPDGRRLQDSTHIQMWRCQSSGVYTRHLTVHYGLTTTGAAMALGQSFV